MYNVTSMYGLQIRLNAMYCIVTCHCYIGNTVSRIHVSD